MHCKSLTTLILVSFLIVSCLPVVISYNISSNDIIYVDDDGGADFTKIQDAIDYANEGDTIFVYNGLYNEEILINKNDLSIIGEDRENTIIKGVETDDGIVINLYNGNTPVINVKINEFTISHYGNSEEERAVNINGDSNTISECIIKPEYSWEVYEIFTFGVYINGYGNTIKNNNISNNVIGIYIEDYDSGNHTISYNTFIKNICSIYSDRTDGNSIIGNEILNGLTGIKIEVGHNNTYENNYIFSNEYDGLNLDVSYDSNIINNTLLSNGKYGYGISQYFGINNIISRNNISGNNNGMEIFESRYNIISDNIINSNINNGLIISFCSDITIKNNKMSFNSNDGVTFRFFSENITVSNNEIVSNKNGINMTFGISNNNIFANTIDSNKDYGLILKYWSDNNKISVNKIENNRYGIYLLECNNNEIYHNNFDNNDYNAISEIGGNIWDDAVKGNYWADYEEKYPNARKKLNGVWNIPYEIPNNNKDRFPLVKPYGKTKSKLFVNNVLVDFFQEYPLLWKVLERVLS